MTALLTKCGIPSITQTERLDFKLGAFNCQITSNSARLIENLKNYLAALSAPADASPDFIIEAIDCEPVLEDLTWTDWPREVGKTGRKEAYIDEETGRWVRKVKTGLVLYQSLDRCIAIGPCAANPNQVINFVNARLMRALQHQGHVVCHAAACNLGQQVMGFAALSGGGKSTLMLHCMQDTEIGFVSNDRLLLKSDGSTVHAAGVAKHPRVNPGTLIHDPHLRAILTPERIESLSQMPAETLWDLEEKYDVDIEAVYGEGRIQLQGRLTGVMILNWSRQSTAPTQITEQRIEQAPHLLGALEKSSGALYLSEKGMPLAPNSPPDRDTYFEVLKDVPLYEITGRVDFRYAADFALKQLRNTV